MKVLNIQETKEGIIDFLYSRNAYVRRVHGDPQFGGEFQTRCPYCGDSQKEYNTGHFYMKVIVGNNSVIPVHCFKCDYSGVFTPETYDLMGGTSEELRNGIIYLNKKGKYIKGASVIEDKYRYYERVIPEEYRYQKKLDYIANRMGKDFTMEEYQEMKVITSLYDFLIANKIKTSLFSKEKRLLLEKDYVGFLSAGNSHILFRDITDTHNMPWVKYPIDEESTTNKVYYGLSASLDMFTEEPITINLAEGVMDILGVHHHLDTRSENVLNYAITGQNYNSIILHLISIGVVGSNVTLNIYSDNDLIYSDNGNQRSSEKMHRKYLEKYKPIFKKINLFYNMKGKDYGVKKEGIIVKKIQI
jgi:predicted nucleic-acid-binding Zn-ribbon protein